MPLKAYVDVDPEEHEHACLAKAMETLAEDRHSPVVFGVWLVGSYPDTKLAVDVIGQKGVTPRNPRITLDWHLWGYHDFGEMDPDETVDVVTIERELAIQIPEYAYR